jgi:hypothetical protein
VSAIRPTAFSASLKKNEKELEILKIQEQPFGWRMTVSIKPDEGKTAFSAMFSLRCP